MLYVVFVVSSKWFAAVGDMLYTSAASCKPLQLGSKCKTVFDSASSAACCLQDPQVQEAVAELQQRKQTLADLQARYKAALEEAEAAMNAPPTMETLEEEDSH